MARTLATTLRRFFTASARNRGDAYFSGERVSNTRVEQESFVATVRGTGVYEVSLRVRGDRIVADCTCPFCVDQGQACKHIWATLRAADDVRAFRVPDNAWLDVPGGRNPYGQHAAAPPPAAWQTFLTRVTTTPASAPAHLLPRGELIYVFDLHRSRQADGLVLGIMMRERKQSGEWGKPKPANLEVGAVAGLTDMTDRRVLQTILGAERSGYATTSWSGYHVSLPIPQEFVLNVTLQRDLALSLCESGRLFVRVTPRSTIPSDQILTPVEWDPAPAVFHLQISQDADKRYTVNGTIWKGGCEHALDEIMVATDVLSFWNPGKPQAPVRLSPFDARGAGPWLAGLLDTGTIAIPEAEAAGLMEALAQLDAAPAECPDELRFETQSITPRPVLRIPGRSTKSHDPYRASADRLDAAVSFDYGDTHVDASSASAAVFDRKRRVAVRRDRAAEHDAIARLHALGVRVLPDWQTGAMRFDLAESAMPLIVRQLALDGWRIEARGRTYRSPGPLRLDVRSGIDWFELRGGVNFEGLEVGLPVLLAAARRGEPFVPLADGTFGVLPEDWLARNTRALTIGMIESDHVRFAASQAALLDAWLAAQPAVSCDDTFARIRGALATFDGLDAVDPPATFRGTLRPYQREALAWFEFLRTFGFGGCLADEMGLGKTVMVLAALDARRLERKRGSDAPRPSLVVVPRSLVFNWQREAARFTPAVRVLDYTGGVRRGVRNRIDTHDLVLTTYGTLRRDIGDLKEMAFDYVILDEAQAIKNASTNAAKAARLLKANHRLALSGTPVENHLGELWSLFEFLNPGVLGSASLFANIGASRDVDRDTLSLLARGLRPFILRRTKDLVASDLPARTEQTLYCDLEPSQRTLYNELRNHYRAALLGRVAQDGLGRSKLQILEALLRLRQAACHPGLVDKSRLTDPSAKLDVLVPRLQELVEDGRQVLVFSQFTTFLGVLRDRLDEAGLPYEYLDGRTRDREARVGRFQNDGCPIFLVSLKAGGLGLNLTAAEYVFLLDPWWNPAVEAQAIDRTHRIGQTRPVFAFRLIARDTVEEKVLELQATKRTLADAIVRADDGLIRNLRREDLELLLS
jgi:superfamily II DNA or RNA helicase